MQRRKPLRAQVGAALQSAAEAAGQAGFAAVRRAVARVDGLSSHINAGQLGSQVVDAITRGTEGVIARSPVPIPGPVRDALGRMHEALGQLSQSIDTVNAGASSLTRDANAQSEAGRRQAMDDARVAFARGEANQDDDVSSASRKSRRNRGRRNARGAEEAPGAVAQGPRTQPTPTNQS